MGRKPDKKTYVLRKRAQMKIRKRKMNPPILGVKVSIEEANRPVLARMAAAISRNA